MGTGAVRPAQAVGIWGAGGLGAHAVRLARMVGAAPVIAVDPLPSARERALVFGADFALDPLAPDFAEAVREATAGRGLDVAFDFAGVGAARAQAASVPGPFGSLVLAGLTPEPVTIADSIGFCFNINQVRGHYGSEPEHVEQLVGLASAGRIDLAPSITAHVPLAEAAEAVARLENKVGDPIRLVLTSDRRPCAKESPPGGRPGRREGSTPAYAGSCPGGTTSTPMPSRTSACRRTVRRPARSGSPALPSRPGSSPTGSPRPPAASSPASRRRPAGARCRRSSRPRCEADHAAKDPRSGRQEMREEYGAVSVLAGHRRGAYPHANSLLVRGAAESLVVDPSLSLVVHRAQGRPRRTHGDGRAPPRSHGRPQRFPRRTGRLELVGSGRPCSSPSCENPARSRTSSDTAGSTAPTSKPPRWNRWNGGRRHGVRTG
ncbi:hypothetical protein GCM10017687_81860 [Streptomyces echinatus]